MAIAYPPAEKLTEKEIVKQWKSIRSEIIAIIENRNAVDNCNDDDNVSDDYADDDNNEGVLGRRQPKGYQKTTAGTFQATITFKGKARTIGTFKYERDAALAYKIAKRKIEAQQPQQLIDDYERILQVSDSKDWNSIRSEVKAIVDSATSKRNGHDTIERQNVVDNCNEDDNDSDDYDDNNNDDVLGRRQPKGYCKTPAGNFEAMVRFKGKKRHIGTFKDERDAALAFKVAKRKIEALQQQLLPSSSSSSNNNNRNRSREKELIHDDANDGNNNDNDAVTNEGAAEEEEDLNEFFEGLLLSDNGRGNDNDNNMVDLTATVDDDDDKKMPAKWKCPHCTSFNNHCASICIACEYNPIEDNDDNDNNDTLWKCSNCTLNNSNTLFECDACGQSSPVAIATATATATATAAAVAATSFINDDADDIDQENPLISADDNIIINNNNNNNNNSNNNNTGLALLLKQLEEYGSSSDEDDDDDGDDVSAGLKPSTTERWNPRNNNNNSNNNNNKSKSKSNKNNEVICFDCTGDDEDGVVIVSPTIMETAPTASMPTSRAIVSSDDDNDDDNDDDDEIQIVRSIGDNAIVDYAHARPDCVVYPFVDKRRSDSNERCCEQCFCFVCDRPVSECMEWSTNHCNAIGGDFNSKWEKLRRLERLRRQQLSNAE